VAVAAGFAGLFFGLAIVWYPAAGFLRMRAQAALDVPNRPAWGDPRPLQRALGLGNRMWALWPVPLAALVVGVGLVVLAYAI
jgi:hypothetical protein